MKKNQKKQTTNLRLVAVALHNATTRKISGAHILRVADMTQKIAHLPKPFFLEINVVSAAQMKGLNESWRGKNKATDVLSFDMRSKDTSWPRVRRVTAMPPSALPNLWSVLFICPTYISQASKRQHQSFSAYLTWSVIHGILHSAGYDHESSARDAMRMEVVEQKILRALKVRS